MPDTDDVIDTHLLVALRVLLTERSVSRAALKTGRSQPTMSNILRRLRSITGDEILVRGRSGMVATERARELLANATQALAAIERIRHGEHKFSPSKSRREFNIGAPDFLDLMFLPRVVEVFRREAPHAKLNLHAIDDSVDVVDALETGALQVVIGNWRNPPQKLHVSRLFEDEAVCMLGRQHPLAAKGVTLKHYLELSHLSPNPHSSALHSFIDASLAECGLRRNIHMTIPYFSLAPYVLMRTDLIFTTGRQFAQQCARDLPISVVPSPFRFPPMTFYQMWHERSHFAPEVIWLRNTIAEAAARATIAPKVE